MHLSGTFMNLNNERTNLLRVCTCEARPEVLGVSVGDLNNRRFHVRHARRQEEHQREGEHLGKIPHIRQISSPYMIFVLQGRYSRSLV